MHFEPVVDPCRFKEIYFHPVNGKGDGIIAIEKIRVMDARQPQEIRPAALGEFQVIRVIDDAREVRVLVVNADGKLVELPLDPA